MRKKRHNYTPEEKVSILKRHLVEHEAVYIVAADIMLAGLGMGREGNRYQPKVLLEAMGQLDYEINITTWKELLKSLMCCVTSVIVKEVFNNIRRYRYRCIFRPLPLSCHSDL